jgi:hypothetical protein
MRTHQLRNVYITNFVKCKWVADVPDSEIQAKMWNPQVVIDHCAERYLSRELNIFRPQIILCFGRAHPKPNRRPLSPLAQTNYPVFEEYQANAPCKKRLDAKQASRGHIPVGLTRIQHALPKNRNTGRRPATAVGQGCPEGTPLSDERMRTAFRSVAGGTAPFQRVRPAHAGLLRLPAANARRALQARGPSSEAWKELVKASARLTHRHMQGGRIRSQYRDVRPVPRRRRCNTSPL